MTKTKELTEGQLEIVAKVEKALTMLGLQYAIKLPNGDVRGVLEPKQRSSYEFPRGEIKAYVEPFLANIEVGQTVVIPADKYGVGRVQSAACRYMSTKHGLDMYISERDTEANTVTINFNCGLE